jgi:YtkA-like protein
MRLSAVLLGLGLALTACKGGNSTASGQPPPAGFQSNGNAEISVKAIPHGDFNRTFVLRAKDRKTGTPICGAKVTVYGQMTSPHLMTLIEHAMRQKRCGMYEGDYSFIMPGTWTATFVLRTKRGDASTAALPVKTGP